MVGSRSLKQVAVEFFTILAFILPYATARAGEGTTVSSAKVPAESRPASDISTPTESQPNASSAAPLAPLLLELRQLKETVEGQSERIAKQTQELESERAAILDQLDRIAMLETELHAPQNKRENFLAAAPVASAVSGSSSPSLAGLGNAAPVPVVQAQTPPAQGSVDRRLGDLEQKLKKLGPLSFSGDFHAYVRTLSLVARATALWIRTCRTTGYVSI